MTTISRATKVVEEEEEEEKNLIIVHVKKL
jgi:hypothetical protein